MTLPSPQDPLEQLELADPEMAATVRETLAGARRSVSAGELDLLVSQTIEALAMASAFGRAVANGFLRLVGRVRFSRLQRYARRLDDARREGAGLGQLLADILPPVLLAEDEGLLAAFDATLAVLLEKGIYTLKGPLGRVAWLLDQGEAAAARSLLGLLAACFALPLSYNRSNYMTQFIPQAVAGLDPRRRSFQIDQLGRVMRVDQHLAEPFVEGLAAGTGSLSAAALDRFVSQALAREEVDGVRAWLSLEAGGARDYCRGLRTGVSLSEVSGQLARYLQARLGRRLPILALDERVGCGDPPRDGAGLVAADGRHLYLPAECDHFENLPENQALYKVLVKLEAACFEFGSFDFDLQRFHLLMGHGPADGAGDVPEGRSDLERLLQRFPCPGLAEALLTIFEHGRLRLALAARYPGLVRQIEPVLDKALDAALADHGPKDFLLPLYAAVALGRSDRLVRQAAADHWPRVAHWMENAVAGLAPGSRVEASAVLVQAAYTELEAFLGCDASTSGDVLDRFWTPFGRRLRPELVGRSFGAHDRLARRVRRALAKRGLRVFQSDLRRRLQRREGALDRSDLHQLILRTGDELGQPATGPVELSDLDLDTLLERNTPAAAAPRADGGLVFRYPEWDARLGEYLIRHTLVRERQLAAADTPFYQRTLARHPGLVGRIRHAFELLKPQGLKLLRPWREGDAFDYRAMLNFAIDKRAGLMPSDRLYVKRIKHQRDVAVLLLVDMSRSTANLARGSNQTVLNVTQTAIVLFCEALQVVGDRFAIAGFSGTGRLGVDYLRIKDFDDAMDRSVAGRIAAMTPLRATRMGAAIRHATHRLAALPAKVRLLMVLGDGFPNDTEYKGMRAISDTRRAIQEARARQIHTKGITVNIGPDARLDELYGRAHHTVIEDVRDLPDSLFKIYGRLTQARV